MVDSNTKVISIKEATKPKGMIATLDDFRKDLENDLVTDFIIIARVKDPMNIKGDGHVVKFDWMGRDSCLICLGLLEYMSTKIKDYIWDR